MLYNSGKLKIVTRGGSSISIIAHSTSNATNLDVSNIDGYENIAVDNFGFIITELICYK